MNYFFPAGILFFFYNFFFIESYVFFIIFFCPFASCLFAKLNLSNFLISFEYNLNVIIHDSVEIGLVSNAIIKDLNEIFLKSYIQSFKNLIKFYVMMQICRHKQITIYMCVYSIYSILTYVVYSMYIVVYV